MSFLEKKRKKNNKILEISMQEICTQYKTRWIYRKEEIPRKKSWKMEVKKEVNEGKMKSKMYGKLYKLPQNRLGNRLK